MMISERLSYFTRGASLPLLPAPKGLVYEAMSQIVLSLMNFDFFVLVI